MTPTHSTAGGRTAIPESKWKWFGMAGHFICADHCLHHLATRIGNFLISTVGDYRPRRNGEQLGEREKIGCDRFFETMVFKIGKGECNCGCGLPAFASSEIDFLSANDHKSADANHRKLCRKYARAALKPAGGE
jgi:hypothetical protein